MAGTKISDLPSASTLTGAELVPVVQSDVTKKTTVTDILTSAGAGTVTSVNVSGGATGLTATGGPITTSGTITLAGTLDVDNGGTGATTAANARTNLDVPSRSGSGASGTWSIDVTGNAGTVTNGVYTSGSYANPSWITSLAGSKITGNISGNAAGLTSTLSTGTGGTGQTTYTNGQLLIGNASGSLSKATLTAGSNVTITNGDGTITIAATGGGSGTVTSVNASGGTTGMTFSGGPITSSGTLTMAGTLAVANGGTNATTAANARINLLPSYTGNGGKVLAVNAGATDTEWITASGSGTVTSVAVSGGSTGLTTSGGPITGAGTITLAGTLGTGYGGTGVTGTPTNGQLLVGNGTGYTLANITAGSGITVTNGSGTITIAATGGGSGTVTSVAVSGGTTGLTTSGGPITGAGTITIAGTLAVANGGTGVTSSSGANSVVLRDSNQNIAVNSVVENFTTITASGTPVVLTVSSAPSYLVSGSGGQTIQLPDATTLNNGVTYAFNNNQSSGAITVNNNSSTLIASVPSGAYVVITLLSNSTAAGTWDRHDQTPANVSWSTNTFDYPGSITSATWNGTVVATNRGGTGLSSFTSGGAVYASSTSVLTTGTLPVASGGTGLTSGTSGGVLYYSAAGTLASSSALAANALVVGGGAGVTPSTVTTGTGVVTALGVNTGSAGAFVVNGGALGTPSSGTVTNLTGTASININGTVGATTPTTGAFTTVAASSTVTLSGLTASTALALDASKNVVSVTNTGTGNNVLATSPTLTTPILGTPTSGNLSNCTADGTNSVGYRNIPQSGSAKTTAYTLATTDVGKFIQVSTSGSIVIPNSTFAAGDVVSVFNNTSGSVTVTCSTTNCYIAGTDTNKTSVTLATRGVVTILFVTSTLSVLTGNVS